MAQDQINDQNYKCKIFEILADSQSIPCYSIKMSDN
jgi:hypothetical protein